MFVRNLLSETCYFSTKTFKKEFIYVVINDSSSNISLCFHQQLLESACIMYSMSVLLVLSVTLHEGLVCISLSISHLFKIKPG